MPTDPLDTPLPCKVCHAEAPFFDAVDASKNCCEPMGLVLPERGVRVAYHRCDACGFVFTAWCDGFTHDDFRREIYNEGYDAVDPLYSVIRPEANARLLGRVLSNACRFDAPPELVDYGAGAGTFGHRLGDAARTRSFDPFSRAGAFAERPDAGYDVVFSSEVLEHVTRPVETLRDMRALLRPGGIVLFSTMVTPADIEVVRAGWWYISPRNGHVSVFTHAALREVCARAGLAYTPLSDEWHLAEHADAPCARLDRDALLAIIAELPTGFVTL